MASYRLDTQTVTLDDSAENTAGIDTSYFRYLSIQGVWSGADATDATIIPEFSNDGNNWEQDTSSAAAVTIGAAAGSDGWEWPRALGWRYVRVAYTPNTNSTGTLTLYYMLKD